MISVKTASAKPDQDPWDKGFDAGYSDAEAGIEHPIIWKMGARAARCGVVRTKDFLEWRDGYDEGFKSGKNG